jgi:hypothetical protein
VTDPARAREATGFGAAEAARRLHVTEAYLRRCERNGFPYALALRASRLLNAPLDSFLRRKHRPPLN